MRNRNLRRIIAESVRYRGRRSPSTERSSLTRARAPSGVASQVRSAALITASRAWTSWEPGVRRTGSAAQSRSFRTLGETRRNWPRSSRDTWLWWMPVRAASSTVCARRASAASARLALTVSCILHTIAHMQKELEPQEPSAAAERHTAVLFAELAGPADAKLPEKELRRLVETLGQAVDLSGGRIVTRREGGLMALFSTPDAAATAAMRIHAYAETLAEKQA